MKKMTIIMIIMMLFTPMVVMAQKFGHIDSQSLIYSLPEVAKIRGELEALSRQYEKEFQAAQDEFQLKADVYDKTKATMSADAQKEMEEKLQEMYNRLQQKVAQGQQDIDKQGEEKMAPLREKIRTAIKNVGKAGHYTYIFDINTALYVGTDSKDITEEVKAELKRMK